MDVVRERLERRDVHDVGLVGERAGGEAVRTSSSMTARKAASVLPEPVGAAISTWRPAAICGHAACCAAVGAAKVRSNQARTAG